MNYCTLFNSHYLSRGLALYQSLLNHTEKFHLYIFAFDDIAYDILTRMQLAYVTVISLKEFETPALLAVKPHRTVAEYCWTSTSSTVLHCLEKYHLKEICYLDADLFFWGDPLTLISEAKDSSMMITEHRYSKEYDHALISGKYCVQFMYFKNDINAMQALHWWRAACLEWCFNRVEEGKFGDQKYLDEWPQRFEGVKVLAHLGGGVAPWNVQQYDINADNQNSILLKERRTGICFPLIFYHFHGLKFINQTIDCGGYKLRSAIYHSLYVPYIQTLLRQEKNSLSKSVNIHGVAIKQNTWLDWLKDIKKKWRGAYNVVPLTEIKN